LRLNGLAIVTPVSGTIAELRIDGLGMIRGVTVSAVRRNRRFLLRGVLPLHKGGCLLRARARHQVSDKWMIQSVYRHALPIKLEEKATRINGTHTGESHAHKWIRWFTLHISQKKEKFAPARFYLQNPVIHLWTKICTCSILFTEPGNPFMAENLYLLDRRHETHLACLCLSEGRCQGYASLPAGWGLGFRV
jgi:hypothetical protein